MEIECFLLCQSAKNDKGEITLSGLFDTLIVNGLPGALSCGTVFLRVRWFPSDAGKKIFQFAFLDPSGNEVSQKQSFVVEAPPHVSLHGIASHYFTHLENAPIKSLGEHSIRFEIDGVMAKTLPLLLLPGGGEPKMN